MKTIQTILFFFSLSIGFGQNAPKTIESLKDELKISKRDTNRIRLMNSLSDNYSGVNIDSAIYYAQQGLALSRQISFKG